MDYILDGLKNHETEPYTQIGPGTAGLAIKMDVELLPYKKLSILEKNVIKPCDHNQY